MVVFLIFDYDVKFWWTEKLPKRADRRGHCNDRNIAGMAFSGRKINSRQMVRRVPNWVITLHTASTYRVWMVRASSRFGSVAALMGWAWCLSALDPCPRSLIDRGVVVRRPTTNLGAA